MHRGIAAVVAFLIPVLALGVAYADDKEMSATKAPEWKLTDTTGKEHKSSDFKDKIVVLEWTEPGCPYVVRHTREKTMNKLVKKYKDKGVVFLGVCSTGRADAASLEKWRKDSGLEYTILFDKSGETGRAYGAKTTPHMFVVKDGKVVYQGAIDNDPRGGNEGRVNHVAQALDEVLAGKAVSTQKTKPYG